MALVVLAGCPPAVRPQPPGPDPEEASDKGAPPPRDLAPRKAPSGIGHGALVGEMCPSGVAGRPGLSPLAVRDVSWSSESDDLTAPLARGSATTFAVLAVDGRRAGVFSSVGTSEVGGVTVAMGSFVGAPPCSRPAAGNQSLPDEDSGRSSSLYP
jgi:hypothetical protein